MSLSRIFKKVRKVVRKVAPVAVPLALTFLAGPAGAGIGARLAGGLARAGSLAGRAASIAGRVLPAVGGMTPPIAPTNGGQPVTPLRTLRALAPTAARLLGRQMGAPNAAMTASLSPEQVQAGPIGGLPGFHQRQALPPIRQGMNMSLLGAISRRVGRIFPGGIRVSPEFSTGGGFPLPSLGSRSLIQVDQFGNPRRKRRRMNPYNPKAARRAIRRIRALRREMAKIERMLPKQKASRPRVQHVPSGYRHRTR